jgi:hypothetical protein
MFSEADLVSRYSSADALRDRVLIDVSAVAREAGIRLRLQRQEAGSCESRTPAAA